MLAKGGQARIVWWIWTLLIFTIATVNHVLLILIASTKNLFSYD